MDSDELTRLVKAWIKFQYAEEASPWKTQLLWAEHTLWQLTEDDPERAWQLILTILQEDSSDIILQNLSAGPLEDLLSAHGDRFIDRVEQEAEHNKRFQTLLGGVWQNEISNAVWQRVQAVAGAPW